MKELLIRSVIPKYPTEHATYFAQRYYYPGLPMTHSLRVFDALEPKFTTFKFVLCVELTL